MIGRKNRYHGHNAVRLTYRQGQTVRGALGSMHYHANDRRRDYRLAVVVSKKVDKSAVARNRIRRRVYEAVRLQADHIKKPYDLVITIYTDEAATMPHDQLEHGVTALLKQAHVIDGKQG